MLRWQRLPLIVALPFVLASCGAASNDHTDNRKPAVIQPATPTGATSTSPIWEITGRSAGTDLRFVVWLAP